MTNVDILKSVSELNLRLKAIFLEENELIRTRDVIERLVKRIDVVNNQIADLEPDAIEKIKLKEQLEVVKLNLDTLIHTKATLGPLKRAMEWLYIEYPHTQQYTFKEILEFLNLERGGLVTKKANLITSIAGITTDVIHYQNLCARREYLVNLLETKESEYDEASTTTHRMRTEINIIETLQNLTI